VPYCSPQVRKDWPVAKDRQRRPATLEQACGQIISRYREKLGFSQMDLAVATGYSLRYVGDIERGTKSATLRTLNDLATLFNIHLGSLITEAEDLLGSKDRHDKLSLGAAGKVPKRRS
jgi:transcriptional regulator with XRE-family HTH domain